MAGGDALEDLLRLAPDAASLTRARKLFFSKRWTLLAGDGHWLWGTYQEVDRRGGTDRANGETRTALRLDPARFLCTCRDPNRPCRHGLALVLLLRNAPERWTVADTYPDWLQAAIERGNRPAAAPPEQRDAATARRLERLQLMQSGMTELEQRLEDILRRGLAEIQQLGPDYWQAFATRLVDAKLPAAARRLRRISDAPERDPATAHETILRELGQLYLLLRAWRKRDRLSADRQTELLTTLGVNLKKEEVLAQRPVVDHWLVLGLREGSEERLRYRRVWLRGEKTQRYALLLDFAFGDQPFERTWPVGSSWDADVHYYPGAYAQRALVARARPGGRPYDGLQGHARIADLDADFRAALARQPWLPQFPVLLTEVTPTLSPNGDLLLLDPAAAALPLPIADPLRWRLLAESGGSALDIFGEYSLDGFAPLALVGGEGVCDF